MSVLPVRPPSETSYLVNVILLGALGILGRVQVPLHISLSLLDNVSRQPEADAPVQRTNHQVADSKSQQMAMNVVAVARVDAALEEESHDRQDAESAQAVLECHAEIVLGKGRHPEFVQNSVAHDARNGKVEHANLAGFVASDALGNSRVDWHCCKCREVLIEV